jgi:type III secretion protein U
MAEKTHKPTAKRLREARKRGEVVRSRELASLGAYLAVWLFLWFGAQFLFDHIASIVTRATDAAGAKESWLPQVQSIVSDMLWTLVPLLGLSVACSVLFGAIQTRGLFSVYPITPQFSRINPAKGLRNLFSTRNLFELGKLIVKVSLLLTVFFFVISTALDPLARLVYAPAAELLRIAATLTWKLMGYAAIVYAIGAALDYAHQSYEFMKQQKMTIEELRRDYQDTEGNPRIKARRRAIARDALEAGAPHPLSAANVVIADGARVAVALYYVSGETPLPMVIGKATGAQALHLRLQAEHDGVPIFEDAALANTLFREVALEDYINESLIDAVSAAFNWAQEVDKRIR